MIGFDFDGTLANDNFFEQAKIMAEGKECCIITTRDRKDIDGQVMARASILNIPEERIFAIGEMLTRRFYDYKADFIKHRSALNEDFVIDVFFDDDPYEIQALQKAGILALWVTPDADSLMAEITQGFMEAHCNVL